MPQCAHCCAPAPAQETGTPQVYPAGCLTLGPLIPHHLPGGTDLLPFNLPYPAQAAPAALPGMAPFLPSPGWDLLLPTAPLGQSQHPAVTQWLHCDATQRLGPYLPCP